MSDRPEQRSATRIVTGGRRSEWLGGAVNVPVARTSTVLFDSVAELREAYPPRDGRLSYGRNGTATQWSLAEALTALEPGAEGTRLFPSGACAVAMALLAVLQPGDELLMVDSAYAPTRHLCDGELQRLGISTRFYSPLASADEVRLLFGRRTRALFMESPGSLTFEVQDVPGLCRAARERDIVTLIDNSWATPLFFRAIAAGVCLSVVSCTKYVGGHSDLMMGAVTAAPGFLEPLARVSQAYGQYVGPDEAALAARGLRTLSVRLERHQHNALTVARWLQRQPKVAQVLHPAFEDCPGHDFWTRDFEGSTGLFSVVLNGGTKADRDRLVDRLQLFGIGYSYGGFESLAVPADPERVCSATEWRAQGPLVRLHVGLEDPDDLIADLAQALDAYPAG
jgi:cysteine-S-conjugate beta-lyase